MRRNPTSSATVTTYGPTGDITGEARTNTYALGAWEQGALQVLLDALAGTWGPVLDVQALAAAETTLGATPGAVKASVEALGALVRGFSQADEATITATRHI